MGVVFEKDLLKSFLPHCSIETFGNLPFLVDFPDCQVCEIATSGGMFGWKIFGNDHPVVLVEVSVNGQVTVVDGIACRMEQRGGWSNPLCLPASTKEDKQKKPKNASGICCQ